MVNLVSSKEIIDSMSLDSLVNKRLKIQLAKDTVPASLARAEAASVNERASFMVNDIIGSTWVVLKILQFGAEGEVYKVRHLQDDIVFVLKTSHIPDFMLQLQSEVDVYKKLDQRLTDMLERELFPEVEGKYEIHVTQKNVSYGYIVITYFADPFMKDYIEQHPPLNIKQSRLVTECLLKTVYILHKGGFVHHDLHGGNVVFVDNSYCKLVDFGRAIDIQKDVIDDVVYVSEEQTDNLAVFKGFLHTIKSEHAFTVENLERRKQSGEDLRYIDYSLVFLSFLGHKWPYGGEWFQVVNDAAFTDLTLYHRILDDLIIYDDWEVEQAIEGIISRLKYDEL